MPRAIVSRDKSNSKIQMAATGMLRQSVCLGIVEEAINNLFMAALSAF